MMGNEHLSLGLRFFKSVATRRVSPTAMATGSLARMEVGRLSMLFSEGT